MLILCFEMQINKVLSARLGKDLEPWKPLIKKAAVEYTAEFIKGEAVSLQLNAMHKTASLDLGAGLSCAVSHQ